jgi:hypothetical protein
VRDLGPKEAEAARRLKAGATVRFAAVILVLALAGCGQRRPDAQDTAGGRLEAAAQAAGLIADPKGSLVGAWARDGDRVCIVPGADGATRIGALVDYGDGQACTASGTLQRSGETVRVNFGDCRFDARFDGERLTFPPEVPAACGQACRGRASFAALAVERQGESASEAATLRAPGGAYLCS